MTPEGQAVPFNADSSPLATLAGAQYVRQLTSLQSDLLARSAFQDLVMRVAPSPSRLFDFGAGPGLDARLFAERGHTVGAYDIDPKMREYFAAYCRDFIDTGRITLHSGGYWEFMGQAIGSNTDLVVSDFAPLNLVDDLPALFAKFHAMTSPRGKVLASVLSPYYAPEMKFRWWWRRLPRLIRDGHCPVACPGGPLNLRLVSNFAALCSPYFSLRRVFCGLPASGSSGALGVPVGRLSWLQWPRLTSSQYIFLLFEKSTVAP